MEAVWDATHWAPTFGERHRYPTIHGLYSHRHVAMCGPEYFGAGILGPGQKKKVLRAIKKDDDKELFDKK